MIFHLKSIDIDSVLHLARSFSQDTKFGKGFNEDIFRKNWINLIDTGIGTIIVSENEGQINGMLGVIKFNDPNNGDLLAQELFWYVDKKYRGTHIGVSLLRECEAWSKLNGCKRLIMAYLSDSMPESVKEFYEMQDYTIMEVNYYKEL